MRPACLHHTSSQCMRELASSSVTEPIRKTNESKCPIALSCHLLECVASIYVKPSQIDETLAKVQGSAGTPNTVGGNGKLLWK